MVVLEVMALGIRTTSWFQEMGKMFSQIQEPECWLSLDEVAALMLLL
jgi:hypothetical protein